MANFLPPAIIEIKALADKAIAEFKDVNKELGNMEKEAEKASSGISGMEKSSKLATGVLLGLGAAFAGFAAIGIKEAMEAETALNKLGSTMSAVGVNTEANREKIKTLTDSYVDLGFSGDSATAGFEKLLRVTGDVDESQKLLALSADLARTKNIGLSEAATILGKASMGNAKAFKEMGIELDTTLPKSEAIAKAMDELNAKIGTQAENATKTFAVQLQIVKERFNDTAESLGAVLLPMIKDLLEKLNKGIAFVKRNSEVFKILAGVFITVTVALAAYNAAIKVQMALTKAWSVITGIQAAVTKLLTGQQVALNTAMKLNPIGLIVSAVTLLIGGFVMLWNKSEAFRKMVIAMSKAAITGFASIIPMVGKVFEVIMKVVTGPLKLFLTVLSKLPGVGKYAKSGLDLLNKGLDGISDFADKASKKAKELAGNLDKLNKPIKIGGGKGLEIPELENTGKGKKSKGGATPEELKKAKAEADKVAKEIAKDNEKALKVIASLHKKIEEAKKNFGNTMVSIEKEYNAKVTKARAIAQEKIAKLDKDTAEKRFKLEKDAVEKRLKLEKDASEKITEAQNKFNDTMANLNKNKAKDLAKLEIDNQNKIIEITKAGQEKQKDIIEQGIARLRSAFKQGTQFDVGELFKGLVENGEISATSLLDVLRNKLGAARQLAENAAKLASLGFSQTFIEQVVSKDPALANKLADSLITATAETIMELQSTFTSLENVSNTALDNLGQTFNDGIRFATVDLAQAYAEATETTTKGLQAQSETFIEAQTEIISTFTEAMGAAEKERDETIAALQKDLAEALTELQKGLSEALAEIQKDYEESIAEINKDLAESLAEAGQEMAEAILEAEQVLTEALERIQDEFAEKLSNINNYVATTIALIQQLQSAMSSLTLMSQGSTGGGTYIPSTTTTGTTTATSTVTNNTTNVTVETTNLTSPLETASTIVSLIKYGQVVQVPSALASQEGGAIGAASIGSKMSLDPAYVAMRAR